MATTMTITCPEVAVEGWKPLATLARLAEVPEASARRYAETFSVFFKSRRVGKAMLYDPGAKEVLRAISDAYGQGQRRSEVQELLAARFGQIHEAVTPRQEVATPAPPADLAPILQTFTASLDKLTAAVERQNALLEQLARAGLALPSPPFREPVQAAAIEQGPTPPAGEVEAKKSRSWWKRLWRG